MQLSEPLRGIERDHQGSEYIEAASKHLHEGCHQNIQYLCEESSPFLPVWANQSGRGIDPLWHFRWAVLAGHRLILKGSRVRLDRLQKPKLRNEAEGVRSVENTHTVD